MIVYFNFGGFYNSYFSEAIDDVIYGEDDEEDTNINIDAIDNKSLNVKVSEVILNSFRDQLDADYGIKLKLKFKGLDSPRYYNFTTDKLIVKLTKGDRKKLRGLVREDSDIEDSLQEDIKNLTTSYPGYVPYYKYKDILGRKTKDSENAYYTCLLETLFNVDAILMESIENIRNTVLENI